MADDYYKGTRFVFVDQLDLGMIFLKQTSSELLNGSFDHADSNFRIAQRFIDQEQIDNYIAHLVRTGMSLYNQKDPITAENILTGAVNFSTSSSEDITLLVKSYLERSLTRFEQDKNLEGVSDLEKVLENTNEEPLSDFLFEARVSSYGLFGNFYLKNFKDHKNSLSSYNNSLDLIH
ncbi:hypothetical protein HN681_00695, partial [archaeon]|nr:hypothetical protein [archaeon]